MTPEQIDRLLANERDIAPSPGFPGSVMRAVAQEANALPALSFPWQRALPGVLACLVALLLGVMALAEHGSLAPILQAQRQLAVTLAHDLYLPWLALAITASLAPLVASPRLADRVTLG